MRYKTSRTRRWGVIFLAAFSIPAAYSTPAEAQEKTPVPEYTGERVYVKDVTDSFQGLNHTIKELERSSPQSYFVVVVRSAGAGENAAMSYVDELYRTWRDQA